MKLTRFQTHARERFIERSTMRGHVQRFNRERVNHTLAVMHCESLKNELAQREKWTVCIGLERGFNDPSYVLTVNVHPYEFKHSLLAGPRPQYGVSDFQNASYRAEMIGRETGQKVARALTDFVEGKESPR